MAACDPFTESEMDAILAGFSGPHALRDRAIFAFGCASGFRVSEILRVRTRDLVNDSGRIRSFVTIAKTKNKEPRRVKLNDFAFGFLEDWLWELQNKLMIRRADSFVFVKSAGEPVSRWQVWHLLRKACEGVDLSREHYGTHSMRKTYAWDIYSYYHRRQVGGEMIDPLIKTQEALGHKKLDSTRAYLASMLGNTDDAVMELYPALRRKYADKSRRLGLGEVEKRRPKRRISKQTTINNKRRLIR